jgi:hypothetical protein
MSFPANAFANLTKDLSRFKKIGPKKTFYMSPKLPHILIELLRISATPRWLFDHRRAALLGCNHPFSSVVKSALMWSEASKKLYGCMSARPERTWPAAVGCVGSGAIRDDDPVLAL